jgi:hypothetical protein
VKARLQVKAIRKKEQGARLKGEGTSLKERGCYRMNKKDIWIVLDIDPVEEDGYTSNDPQKTMNEGFSRNGR